MSSILENKPLIYLITDGETTEANFSEKTKRTLELIKTAVALKVHLIQIREKKLSAKLIFELASEAVKITRNSQTKVLINDRADIVLAANADGVHLTSESLQANTIRENFPRKFIIGVSAHTLAEVEVAKRQGADFITFSPIFKTPSKEKYGEPQGLEKLREVCEKLKPFPVIALGGIDETNYKTVLETGASGFAAIRFLHNAENLMKLDAEFNAKTQGRRDAKN